MMSASPIQQNPGRSAIVSAKAKKTKFMAVMELAKPLFPNLTDIQIIEYVDRVKKKFGTLKGKTNDEIIQEMCKFMQAEGKTLLLLGRHLGLQFYMNNICLCKYHLQKLCFFSPQKMNMNVQSALPR